MEFLGTFLEVVELDRKFLTEVESGSSSEIDLVEGRDYQLNWSRLDPAAWEVVCPGNHGHGKERAVSEVFRLGEGDL